MLEQRFKGLKLPQEAKTRLPQEAKKKVQKGSKGSSFLKKLKRRFKMFKLSKNCAKRRKLSGHEPRHTADGFENQKLVSKWEQWSTTMKSSLQLLRDGLRDLSLPSGRENITWFANRGKAQKSPEVRRQGSQPRLCNLRTSTTCVIIEHSIDDDCAKLPGLKSLEAKIAIIDDVSGIIKPGKTTLLLGPPGCGKTTLRKALSGNLRKSLKVNQFRDEGCGERYTKDLKTNWMRLVTGEVSYNGYKLEEFIPQKTSTYISQNDLHIPEMTVRETLDFSARYQGIGSRVEIMIEVSRREKQSRIVPDPDVDIYMKAISAEGQKTTLQILGLDICAYTLIGDAMRRGISGGQKKRLTTEGKIVYHGPCSHVLEFFEDCGFRCSERKGVADFLQEVISKKDQAQYCKLAVFYKQRDLYFYPTWAYAIPATILKVPISLFSALNWTSLAYYVVGYSPKAGRIG
ncbi:unnamed protein product [Camellia sinensis]